MKISDLNARKCYYIEGMDWRKLRSKELSQFVLVTKYVFAMTKSRSMK
jgi:hypothetical protein